MTDGGADERTGLLSSSQTVSYQTESHQETSSSVVNIGSVSGPSADQVDGAPVVHVQLLTRTVKKVIKHHRKAEALVTIRQQQQMASAAVGARQQNKSASKSDANGKRVSGDDGNSSSSSSSSDDERVATASVLSVRRRKRDQIKDALKHATGHWREKHGWHQSSSGTLVPPAADTGASQVGSPEIPQDTSGEALSPLPTAAITMVPPLTVPPVEHDIWRIAKHASVCSILVLVKQTRTPASPYPVADEETQRLALAALDYGLKESKGSKAFVYRNALLRPWIDNRCALEWAVEKDCQVFLSDARVQRVIQETWRTGVKDWREDGLDHPNTVWIQSGQDTDKPRPVTATNDYLARWASPRYQALVSLCVGIVYMALHLTVLANQDYRSDYLKLYDYPYYVFVVSDVLLELVKLFTKPKTSLQRPSTYLSVLTAGLLVASFVYRLLGLANTRDLAKADSLLSTSSTLLMWATPLMFFRFGLWMDDLCWPVAKTRYLTGQCILQSLWALGLGVFILISFWIGLGALQREYMDMLTTLQYLLLGALHAPNVGDTLYLQPMSAGIMLIVYLFLMVVVLTALIIASFLATLLAEFPRMEANQRLFEARRSCKKPELGMYIPSMAVELVAGALTLLVLALTKLIKPLQDKRPAMMRGVERARQVVWYIMYLPVILLVALLEGACSLYERARAAISRRCH